MMSRMLSISRVCRRRPRPQPAPRAMFGYRIEGVRIDDGKVVQPRSVFFGNRLLADVNQTWLHRSRRVGGRLHSQQRAMQNQRLLPLLWT